MTRIQNILEALKNTKIQALLKHFLDEETATEVFRDIPKFVRDRNAVTLETLEDTLIDNKVDKATITKILDKLK